MSVPPSPGNPSWVSKPTPFCSSPNTTASPAPTSVFTDQVLVLGHEHDQVAEADAWPARSCRRAAAPSSLRSSVPSPMLTS